MPESREDFILLQTIEPVQTGEAYRNIPPHVTALSWFSIRRALLDDLIPLLDNLAGEYGEKSKIGIGRERVLFGVNEDIPACTIDVPIFEIHDSVMDWVDTADGTFKFERFARKLDPHVSDEGQVSIQPAQKVKFSTLALFSVYDVARKMKRVEFAAQLGE